MKILVFGSLNIDHTYRMDHIVQPKETAFADSYQQAAGGKGLNQAIALAKSGVEVQLAGSIGPDGEMLLEVLREYGVDTALLKKSEQPTGHAIIQVDKQGENSIFVYHGANYQITHEYIDSVLAAFNEGDYLVLQNEINNQDYLIHQAHQKGLTIFMNPSPCDESINSLPLELIDYFFINEVEGEVMTSHQEPEAIMESFLLKYPHSHLILTLGGNGAYYHDNQQTVYQPAYPVKVVDSVGAGDTFMGYFIYATSGNMSVAERLKLAARASSLTIQKAGAAQSIPTLEEVNKVM